MISLFMQIQKLKKLHKASLTHRQMTVLAVGLLFMAATLTTQLAVADRFDEQIDRLKDRNSNREGRQDVLEDQAATLNERINNLRIDIESLEAQILRDQARSRQLRQRIAAAEAELERQKDLLGQNIKAMYLEGQISTIEMLATSKDLSEFVDKEQYRSSVKDKIRDTLETVQDLRERLNKARESLEQTIANSQNRQSRLDSRRTEQRQLLSMNAAQRAVLDRQIRRTNNEIERLRSEQAVANARFFGGNGYRNVVDRSGYPWGGYEPFPNSVSDNWGMYLRQCVSYTAWKVDNSGRTMPYWGGRGNANQWDDNARAEGIPVDTRPRVGDVAVLHIGAYGHVMYVEEVLGGGRIRISQYNAGWDGKYSEAVIPTDGLLFIHF